MVKHFPGSGPVDGGKDSHFPLDYNLTKEIILIITLFLLRLLLMSEQPP